MNTELTKAAQQALEVLKQLQGGCTDSDDGTVEAITVWCPEVIDALERALTAAQPAQAYAHPDTLPPKGDSVTKLAPSIHEDNYRVLASAITDLRNMLDLKTGDSLLAAVQGLKSARAETNRIVALLDAANDECKALRAEVERLRADGERMDWLRSEHERHDPVCHLSWKLNNDRSSSEWVNTAQLDTAIDAARKEAT